MNKKTKIIVLIVLLIAIIFALIYIYLPEKSIKEPQSVSNEPVQTATLINTVLYSCNGGKTINTAYYQGENKPPAGPDMPPIPGGSVVLNLSDGRNMTLNQTISADGARYANPDESFVFWSKGEGALVLENNQEKSYIGCIVVKPELARQDLSQIYSSSTENFSLRYPAGCTVDESYSYQELGPGKDIYGVKFTIPESVATGTNLGTDSYVSVEQIPKTTICSANLFLDTKTKANNITDGDTTYSFAASNGAGAGNRYEEAVYAIPGTNPCVAIRYFIHYSVLENYPAGTVKQFDEASIISEFDQIRNTLTVNQ
jgi:membrane-bound inhibitor of C-type lysozyme